MIELFSVYMHTCPNGKIYIGISHNPIVRWANGKGYVHNKYFTKAIQKYGWDNIKHEILYENLTKEEACRKEIELIAQYKSNQKEFGYNSSIGGEVNCGFHHSEESKRKIREHGKGKHTGRFTENRKKNISIATKKAMNKPQVKEKIINISKLRTGEKSARGKSVINLDTQEVFATVRFAAQYYSISETNLASCCRGERLTAGGFHWAYEKEVTQ